MKKVCFLLLMLIMVTSTLKSQILAWDFNGGAGNEVSVASTTTNSGISSSSIVRGAGVTATSLANAFSANGWDNASLATAITDNAYFEFTVKALTGNSVSLSTLDANFRRSGTGPIDFQWQYSLDGFATSANIGSAINYTGTTTNGDAQTQIDLSGISALQNVPSATTITIRLYGWNATQATGTFALGRLAGNDLAIGGSVTIPPCSGTPSSQAGFGTITPADITATINVTAGVGGDGRVLKINTSNSFTNMTDGDNPTANTAYGGGEQVIYNGNGTGPVNVTGLTASTTYYLAVYEYKCVAGRFYLNPGATTSFSTTAATPLGWQITTTNTAFFVDFDNTANNVNNGQFAGVNLNPNPQPGDLNSNAIAIDGSSGTAAASFGGTITTGGGTSTGGVSSGNFFAFEHSTGNRALGVQPTGTFWSPGSITLRVQNKTGGVLSSLSLAYKIFELNNEGRANSFNFQYSTDNATYTNVSSLDFTSEETASGTPAWRAYLRSTTITGLSLADGDYLYLRWVGDDVSGLNSRDEFALDDISVVANPVSVFAQTGGTIESGIINGNTQLNNDLTINSNFNLINGKLLLGDNDASAGSITGGTSANYVQTNGSGSFTINAIGAGPVTFPVGNAAYNPVIIENGSGHNWAVRVADTITADPSYNTNKAVLLSWMITPSQNPPAGGADITFQFNEATQVGGSFVTTNPIQAWRRPFGRWVTSGAPAALNTSVPNAATVKFTGLTGFSQYGLANDDGPLPVHFYNVKAYPQGSGIRVDWSNLAESDVSKYTVERSADGRQFTSLADIPAAKNDGGQADYSYFDMAPLNGVSYYRIRSSEFAGNKMYSIIVRVNTRGGNTEISIYPNPVSGGLFSLQANELAKGEYSIKIISATGQQVFSQSFKHQGGFITQSVQLPATLQPGMYNLLLTGETLKLSKNFILR